MIVEWIAVAAERCGVKPRRLASADVSRLMQRINSYFTIPRQSPCRLWETFVDDFSRRRQDGWSLICDFPEISPILLIENDLQFDGFAFRSADEMRAVLAESPGFEFYVTNSSATFVLCHNHHDYLIGVGSCREWLLSISSDE